MGTDHPPRDKQAHLDQPSLWVAKPADASLSLLENALRGDEPSLWDDEHSDDMHALLEENARLRRLLAQLSNLILQKRRSSNITPHQYHGRTVPSLGGRMRRDLADAPHFLH